MTYVGKAYVLAMHLAATGQLDRPRRSRVRDRRPSRTSDAGVEKPRRNPDPNPSVRHCWVLEMPGKRPHPGLILEWRKTDAADWSARVVYAPHPKSPRSIEAWFAAAAVRTATSSEPHGPRLT